MRPGGSRQGEQRIPAKNLQLSAEGPAEENGAKFCLVRIDPDSEGVIGASPGPLPGRAVHDLDGSGSLLAAKEVFGPSTGVEGGIEQLGTSVGLGEQHY